MTHGKLTTYKKGCRCEDCVRCQSTYSKRLRYERAPRLVEARPAHSKIRAWLRQGYTTQAIADSLGFVSYNSVHSLMKRDRMRRSTLNRILQAQPTAASIGDRSRRDATGTVRRLQALATRGFGVTAIAEELGLHQPTVTDIRRGRFTNVEHHNAVAIAGLYEQWQHLDGGSARAKAQADRFRWAPPAAWDDIDDPNEEPKW